ncbi:hypothetical protein Y032_0699g1632 [Ancylostoma ceylanicum]|uniref:Uncharacterized protein n=1 Tax=Ancylostoma ceylanicum TaxID=53326 RepID=A0A016WIA1_9BILA|nr:hypothetical protein Y032_0699g1632 [Ancylostoma ceylanicum]
MVFQIQTSTPCRPGIPSGSDYIFPASPTCRGGGAMPHSILKKPPFSVGSNDMISSQTSDANTVSSGSSVSGDMAKLRIAQRLLTTMVVATGVSSVMSLQFFLQVNWSTLISKFVTLKEFYQIASEVGETLDIAVVICSTSAFFISLLQLFFVMKLQKSQNSPALVPRTNEFHAFGDLFVLVSRRYVDDDSSSAPLCSESHAWYDIQRGGAVTGSLCDIVLFRGNAEDGYVLDAVVTVADKR